jgi:hypothetical protein
MAIYLCRWPNGEFSVVSAKTKSDAIELLDEWGNAEQASLSRMPDCMFDFRLDDDGQIELADIGEAIASCRAEASHRTAPVGSPAQSPPSFFPCGS